MELKDMCHYSNASDRYVEIDLALRSNGGQIAPLENIWLKDRPRSYQSFVQCSEGIENWECPKREKR